MSELSKVPFLAHLDSADLQALGARLEERSYEEGDIIYAEGTPGDGLYYVASGTVAVWTSAGCDGEIMAHLPAGSTFGESSLLYEHPRSNAVRAAGDCTVRVLTRSAFQSFLAERPGAGQLISLALLQRPARSARQLVAELLRPMPMFANVADDALLAVARKLQPSNVCAEAIVFSEGQAPDALYLVESGTVELLVSSGVMAEIGQRDYFGEDALLTDQPRELTARAASAANLWALQRADFDALATPHPAAVLSLTRALAARSEKWNRKLLEMAGQRPARTARPQIAAPILRTRPTVSRQPLLVGLKSWFSGLSTEGRLRLAVIGVLAAWLLLISLPTAIAGTVHNSSPNGVIDTRNVALVRSARGGAAVRGPEATEVADLSSFVVADAADAPLARLIDLAPEQKPVVAQAVTAPSPTSATAAAVQAAPVAVAQPQKQEIKYTVVSGDTLGQIAQEFGLDVEVLAEANGIDNPALIRVDQELVIPGGEEQAKIAAELVNRPRPTPAPAPAPVVSVAAAPVVEKPALPFTWDSRVDKWNVRLEPAAVAEGQKYFRLTKALFRDTNEPVKPDLPGGDHNIYVEVLDESGKRMLGAKALVRNGGTATLLIENKPFPEYASNFPMYGMMGSYTALVDGLPSDQVIGMGLPMKWHVSFFLTFQLTTK